MCHYQFWTPLTPTLAQALATSLEMPCWYPISQNHGRLCLSVASALSSAHILAGGDQCSCSLVFISDVLVSGITVPSTTSCPTRSTGAAGMPRRNQGVHLPWRPRRVPQDARAPTGPAVKKPIRAAIPCSNPVAVNEPGRAQCCC